MPYPKTETKAAGGRNSVRIIGGSWRGRRVAFPDEDGLRPTPDRVRETLFNWLQNDIVGAHCLDLFAGSGALGLEALSRGAATVTFVEQAPAAARAIEAAVGLFGAASRATVRGTGAARFLKSAGETFNLVFLDPPFGHGGFSEYLLLLDSGTLLRTPALVYPENERKAGAPALPPHWELLKSKSAGEVGYHLARVPART